MRLWHDTIQYLVISESHCLHVAYRNTILTQSAKHGSNVLRRCPSHRKCSRWWSRSRNQWGTESSIQSKSWGSLHSENSHMINKCSSYLKMSKLESKPCGTHLDYPMYKGQAIREAVWYHDLHINVQGSFWVILTPEWTFPIRKWQGKLSRELVQNSLNKPLIF